MFRVKIERLVALVLVISCCLEVIHCDGYLDQYRGDGRYLVNLGILCKELEDAMLSMQAGSVSWLDGIPPFIEKIKSIKEVAKAFIDEVPLPDRSTYYDTLLAAYSRKFSNQPTLFTGLSQSNLYKSTGLDIIERQVRRIIYDKDIWNQPISQWHQLDQQCRIISYYTGNFDAGYDISILFACRDLGNRGCPGNARPFSSRFDDQDMRICHKDPRTDQSCNLRNSLPIMARLYSLKVNQMIGFYVCCKTENEYRDECHNFEPSYRAVMREADLFIAFAYSHPDFWQPTWAQFFHDAVSNNALVDIHHALDNIKEKKNLFETTTVICNDLEGSAEACLYHDIFKQYRLILIKQNLQYEPRFLKDLRLHTNINLEKTIELQQLKLKQIELLGAIDTLDGNLESSVGGISTFLGNLAKFDKGIALADVEFIKGSVTNFTESMTTVENKLAADLSEASIYMTTATAIELVEQAALLAASIITNSNPLKAIFTGPDVVDVGERIGMTAQATADVVHSAALVHAIEALDADSEKFMEAFMGNDQQISHLKSVTDQILANNENNLNEDADKFLEEYAAYTPEVNRAHIAHNNALWSAYKESTCALLEAGSGAGSAVVEGIAAVQLLCEKLEGTLAQYFTLREDIFDFQFQLVNAIAAVVRGNIAERLAEGIKGKGDVVNGAQLMLTSLITQYNLQTTAATLCDVLEYRNLGHQTFTGCATLQGLFSRENINKLITNVEENKLTYHKIDRFVKIPTQPSFPGDYSYVDLNTLASGHEVIFKLPKNQTWLKEHRWVATGQSEPLVPFVESLEVFLPHKTYASIPSESTMSITMQAIKGSYVSTLNPETDVSYLLPWESGHYSTVYEENYRRCSNEMKNLYSLCDNLPSVCLLSSRLPGNEALLPTTLSTWSFKLKREKGANKLQWEAPHSATKFLLHGKASFLYRVREKEHVKKSIEKKSDVVVTNRVCCDGNKYNVDDVCVACPSQSTSLLRGYYCEINQGDSTSSHHHQHHQQQKQQQHHHHQH